MAFAHILTDAEIAAALESCKEPESFNSKTFFAKSGLHGKSKEQMMEIFAIFDQNNDGFIDRKELQQFLQLFDKSARLLTGKETKVFLQEGDTNGDGKIGFEEFVALVRA